MNFLKKKNNKVNVSVVIVAAGSGSRMGSEIPKQFLEVSGKPILAYTIDKFDSLESVNEIVVVTRSDSIVLCGDIVKQYEYKKVKTIIEGGATRQESVYKGLCALGEDSQYVLIHDGARPLISSDAIDRCISSVIKNNACAVGVPLVDTIKYSDTGEYITKTVDRSRLWSIQTPQAFEKELIINYHKKAIEDNFSATDDCMLLEHYGEKIALVEGEYENIKITSPIDIFVMEGIINENRNWI